MKRIYHVYKFDPYGPNKEYGWFLSKEDAEKVYKANRGADVSCIDVFESQKEYKNSLKSKEN